jgi:trimethylamine:corrinoid methyltransferase-like protein
MRPVLKLLSDDLIANVVSEARGLLCTLGVEIHNQSVAAMLCDYGAAAGAADARVRLTQGLIDRALRTVPRSFRLFDALGNPTHDFSGDHVYFTPGSAAIQILDGATGEMRPPPPTTSAT